MFLLLLISSKVYIWVLVVYFKMDQGTDYRFKPRERIFCLDGERFLIDGVPFHHLEEFLSTLDSVPIQLLGGQEQYRLRYQGGTLEIELESFDDGKLMRNPPDDFYALEKVNGEGNILRVVPRDTLAEPMVKYISVRKKKS